MPASTRSSVGGAISRRDALDRAQHWVRMGFTYGTVFRDGEVVHTETKPDSAGRAYRTDCSGLVSMAWHLSASRTTRDFARWSGTVRLPGLDDLKPGDALLRPGHIELFARWVNPAKHAAGAFVFSFNRTGETVQNPNAETNRGNLGRNSIKDMETYSPLRYKQILDESTIAHPDGTFLREPNKTISLVAGGAPFHLRPEEYASLGSPPWVPVPTGTFTAMPGAVRDGALLGLLDGTLFVVAGSAKYHLSPQEWAAMNKPHFVRVPQRLTDALDDMPADNTFLRDMTTGRIYHVVGDARHHLTPEEYAILGRPAYTNVPVGFIDSVTGSVPAGAMFVRSAVNGAIYQVVGGARYHLNPDEYAALHKPSVINVADGMLKVLGAVPVDHTYLRDVADGAIYEIVGAAKRHVTPQEWAERDDVTFTNVPRGFLNTLPNV